MPLKWMTALAAWCSMLVVPAAPATAAASAQGAVVSANGTLAVRHETLRLANGFEVILVEDHRLPLVAVNLWVHAGPRNEARGQTGFAHLFEHLMFAGSRHIPRGEADKIIDAAGGTDSNGSTNFDRTNYFFTLPSNQLELGLWIKSDMLGYMIDEVDSMALANQQDVVRNERRERSENRPYGVVDEALYQALFPEGHPYRALVIGSHADIQSIQLADVKAFARTYYRPNNATLVLAGDFKPADAKRLVQKYFGPLQRGEPVPPVTVARPQITSEKRLQVTDRIELPRLTLAWHTPAIFQPGDADLDVASHILAGGRSSRLYTKLVYQRQIAQEVDAEQDSRSLGSVFAVEVVARPGQSLDEIESGVDAELAELAARPPSLEEVQRALATIETRLLARMEKIGSLADMINNYNQMAGDPGFVGKDLARYRAVTPESVRSAVAALLGKQARVVMHAVPGPKVLAAEVPTPPAPTAAAAKGEREALNADEPWRSKPPRPGKAQALHLPAGQRFTLANGLTVVHLAQPGLPLVSAELVVHAGQTANPAALPGLSGFTAAMLTEGTASRSSQQLADQVADLGATLTSGASRDEAHVELSSLKAHFAAGLALLADVALNPVFKPAEVERVRSARLAALAQQREQPEAVAALVGNRMVFGDGHPLAANALGDEAAIKATDSAALTSFWRAHYRPDQAALVVVGDIAEAELRQLAEHLFAPWQRPPAAYAAAATPAPHSSAARVVFVDKPGAAQTALAVMSLGPHAATPDAAPIEVMNAALGGLFTSRLITQLREVKGYTYAVSSRFVLGRDSGQFIIRGSVRTEVTGAALVDLFKEIDDLRAHPMGQQELSRVRNAELLSLPGQFDTNRNIMHSYAATWAAGLPADHITRLPARLAAVNASTAQRAAKEHVDPDRMIVVAVGDKAQVLSQLQALKREPLELRDASGSPLK